MVQTIFGISDKLDEKVTKKQFLKECGLFLLGVVLVPSLLTSFVIKPRLRIDGDNLFLDDELLIERREV